MNALIVLALVGIAAGIKYAVGGNSAGFFKGQTRTVSFNDGKSTPERASQLRVLFERVNDRGNGVYEVTANFDGNVSLPSGTRVAGVGAAAPIVLYAIFHKGRHVGFAFGAGPAAVISKVLNGAKAQRSNQPMPKEWGYSWRPVWGNDSHTTIWGRFISPYDEALLTYLRWAGYPAATPKPTRPGQDYLALRDVY